MAITRDGFAQVSVGIQTATVTTGDIPTGSWMIAVWVHNSTSLTETIPAGWTVLVPGTLAAAQTGSRRYTILGKIRGKLADGSADASDTGKLNYTFILSADNTQRVGIFWGSGMRAFQIGTSRKRNGIAEPEAGAENFLAISNGVTTTEPNTLMLSFAVEATTAAESAITSITGATAWTFLAQGTGGNTGVIETIHASYKDMPTAGDTGNVTIRYPNSQATNAGATQIILLPTADTIPTTGQVAAYGNLIPAATSISLGSKKLSGTGTIEAVLYNAAGTTELARQTVAHNATTGWGNAAFTGLTPATRYLVRYLVGGVVQTDATITPKTQLSAGVAANYKAVLGSCQFTASNHPVWDRIREEGPEFLGHMGDMHYVDATTDSAWRSGMDASLSAARFHQLLGIVAMYWSMDNHDRIMTNPGGAGTALNLGETDPQTQIQWKQLAGATGWATADTLGRTWTVGRVQYISLDMWSVRDDADFDPEPRTFLGSAQKQWFKDVLSASTATVIVWLSQWTNRNNANGRWNSFPTETSEIEAWLDARPQIKRRLIMIGGDSHSLQAGDGDYSGQTGYRFVGVPSLNFSGFNRSGDAGDGSTGWNIINEAVRATGSAEADWGAYSLIDIQDDGTHLRFVWKGIVVDVAGTRTEVATFERSFGQAFDRVAVGGVLADVLSVGSQVIWKRDVKGKL